MESDEEYLFMNDYDPKFDYKLMAQEMKRVEPVEYKGVNYIVQAGNLDKAIAAQLWAKREYNWGELDETPIVMTTEDFKAIALTINAENLRRMGEEVGDTIE